MREPWVDALRTLALLGVFIVNALGYAVAPNYPLPIGAPSPVDSVVAQSLYGFLIALVQGKAYPLLCFLFGYSLCILASKTHGNELSMRHLLNQRYKKLLLIGVLHGTFIYFGDVLTIYAVCGLLSAKWVSHRPARLLLIFRNITYLLIAVYALNAFTALTLWMDDGQIEFDFYSDMAKIVAHEMTISSFWQHNAKTYLSFVFHALFQLPIYLWLTVAGVLACRFRLFTLRSYSRKFWTKHFKFWHFCFVFLLNFILSMAIAYQQHVGNISKLAALIVMSSLINIWLLAATLAMCMRYWQKVIHLPKFMLWLAPAGRHTLMMYLVLSLSLMLSGRAFLNLQASSLVVFIVAVCAWLSAVFLARYATKRRLRDPVARWLSITHVGEALSKPSTARERLL